MDCSRTVLTSKQAKQYKYSLGFKAELHVLPEKPKQHKLQYQNFLNLTRTQRLGEYTGTMPGDIGILTKQ